jgi:hypothetical protein
VRVLLIEYLSAPAFSSASRPVRAPGLRIVTVVLIDVQRMSQATASDDLAVDQSNSPRPSQYAACAAFRQPVRRYNPDKCWRTVVSLIPSS